MPPYLIWAIKHWKAVLAVVGILIYFGHTSWLRHQNDNLREDLTAQRLVTDSVEAVSDTTREVTLEVLADVSRYYERRVVQTELERDSIDQELNQVSRSRAQLSARIDSLRRQVRSDTTYLSNDVRYAEFNFYNEPYTVDASVSIPPPPEPADLEIDIRLDQIPFDVRIGCSGDGEIRRASIGVTGPTWAEVQIEDVRQEPEVCNPQLAVPERGWFDQNRGKLGIAAGVVGVFMFKQVF